MSSSSYNVDLKVDGQSDMVRHIILSHVHHIV